MAEPPKAEVYLDTKWDKCIDVTIRKVAYGTLAGAAAALLLFRGSGRAAAIAFGAGLGAGSAYEVCEQEFKDLSPPKR